VIARPDARARFRGPRKETNGRALNLEPSSSSRFEDWLTLMHVDAWQLLAQN